MEMTSEIEVLELVFVIRGLLLGLMSGRIHDEDDADPDLAEARVRDHQCGMGLGEGWG